MNQQNNQPESGKCAIVWCWTAGSLHVLVQDVKARWAGQDSLQTEVIGNLADLVPNA